MDEKATLRAQMAMVGMSQGMLAAEMGVEARSVRRWVSTSYPDYRPPQEAMDLVAAHLGQQRRVIDFALSKVDEAEADLGAAPDHAALPFWASQKDYDAAHLDGGDYRMANANILAVAQILASRGIRTEWRSSL